MHPQEAYLATKTFSNLGIRRALALWKNGIKSTAELGFMSDKDILELPGINNVGLAEIRQYYPIVSWTKLLDRTYKDMLVEVSMTDADEAVK